MKMTEDGPKCGPKHVAVTKYNQCNQLDWFIFYCCVDGMNTTNHYAQQDINKIYSLIFNIL
jgi:hypothetical protein